MKTIKGRVPVVRQFQPHPIGGVPKWFITDGAPRASYLCHDGKWHEKIHLLEGYWPTEADAREFAIEVAGREADHISDAGKMVADLEETTVATASGDWTVRKIGDAICIIDEQGRQRHVSQGHLLTAAYYAGALAERPFESTPQIDSILRQSAERFLTRKAPQ